MHNAHVVHSKKHPTSKTKHNIYLNHRICLFKPASLSSLAHPCLLQLPSKLLVLDRWSSFSAGSSRSRRGNGPSQLGPLGERTRTRLLGARGRPGFFKFRVWSGLDARRYVTTACPAGRGPQSGGSRLLGGKVGEDTGSSPGQWTLKFRIWSKSPTKLLKVPRNINCNFPSPFTSPTLAFTVPLPKIILSSVGTGNLFTRIDTS